MLSFFLTQIVAISKISLLFVFLYHYIPRYLFSFSGILLSALLVGLYVGVVQYQAVHNQANRLLYVPTGLYRQHFNDEISKCGLKPQDVNIRYAYTDENIALTMANTIAIDPIIWSGFEHDPECTKAKEVVETHIIPTIPEHKKKFYEQIKGALSPKAQKFILRHEVGHVFNDFFKKAILSIGVIGALATSAGLITASLAIGVLGGIGALVIGIATSSVCDLLLTFLSNLFFKVTAEKNADLFAVSLSSKEEIEAAADFFEQYELYAQEYRKQINDITAYISPDLLTGHPDGITRAHYLRDAALCTL